MSTRVSEARHAFTLSIPQGNLERVEIWTLTILLILLQLADGFLTFWGVTVFGINAEGNPLLQFLMAHWGEGLALFVAKSVAIVACVLLYFSKARHNVLRHGMWGVAVFYVLFAVIPWSLIFFAYNVGPVLAEVLFLLIRSA